MNGEDDGSLFLCSKKVMVVMFKKEHKKNFFLIGVRNGYFRENQRVWQDAAGKNRRAVRAGEFNVRAIGKLFEPGSSIII